MKVTIQYKCSEEKGWKSMPQEDKTWEQIQDLQQWIDKCWVDRYRLVIDQKELKAKQDKQPEWDINEL